MPLLITTRDQLYRNRKVSHRLTGANLADVAQEIDRIRIEDPSMPVGFFDAKTEYKYKTDSHGRLTADNFTYTVRCAAWMPSWANLDHASKAEKTEWQRFWNALWMHECGHHDIAIAGYTRLYTALLQQSPAHLAAFHATEEAKISVKQGDYDRNTKHGVTQKTAYGSTTIVWDNHAYNNSTPEKDVAHATQAETRKRNRGSIREIGGGS